MSKNMNEVDLGVIAYQCIARSREGRCNGKCEKCLYNINLYSGTPEEKAFAMASKNAQYEYSHQSGDESLGLLVLALICIVCLWCCTPSACSSKKEVTHNESAVEKTLAVAQKDEAPSEFVTFHPQPYKQPDLEATLRKVHATIRDVNYDGKINCIDYAVRFYELMPMTVFGWHKNTEAGVLNHLFVGYKDNAINKVRLVEPQETTWVTPQDFWGDRYGKKYILVDEAEIWEIYGKYREWDWDNYNKRGWEWNEETGVLMEPVISILFKILKEIRTRQISLQGVLH